MTPRKIVINLVFDEENPWEDNLYTKLSEQATSVICACLGEARKHNCMKNWEIQKMFESIDEQDEIEKRYFHVQKLEEQERDKMAENYLNGE